MYIKLLDKIKSVFNDDNKTETEKIIISQKSCPHCASRGMFVFNNTSINSKTTNKVKSKDQSPSETVEE